MPISISATWPPPARRSSHPPSPAAFLHDTVRPGARASAGRAVGRPASALDSAAQTSRTRRSSSTSMRAVAPHTVSWGSSKNHTGNEPSSPTGRSTSVGHDPASSRNTPSAASSAREPRRRRAPPRGVGHQRRADAARIPTTGVIVAPEEKVASGVSRPTTSTEPGSSPTSSAASRRAPASGRLPGVEPAPGEAHLPRWVRRWAARRVSTTRASPCLLEQRHQHGRGGPGSGNPSKVTAGPARPRRVPATARRTRASLIPSGDPRVEPGPRAGAPA